jgi:hypothetical protein
MLTHAEALPCAAVELTHDSELLGTEIVAGPGVETPGFWLFHPNTRRAFETGRAADSLAYRIPAVVVDRRTGVVTRPFAAGARVAVSALGPDEWVILPEPETLREHDSLEGLALTEADAASLQRLAHFRVRRGGRDSGDRLEAGFVATSPGIIDAALAEAGLHRTESGWSFGGDERVGGSVQPDTASVALTLSQSGSTDHSWTFGRVDIALAQRVEDALRDAEWIRFWF